MQVNKNWSLIFVDTEHANPTKDGWTLAEFGAVDFHTRKVFYGKDSSKQTFLNFSNWLHELKFAEFEMGSGIAEPQQKRLVFIADNPAYDWPPIHFYLMKYCHYNPFGHSARRIGDFYAGLRGDFHKSSEWKRLRITPHDHNPVNDAMGNVEAFERMIKGEK